MNLYTISVIMSKKEAYLVGEADHTIDIPYPAWSGSSFQVARRDMTALLFTDQKNKANVMSPKNVRSWLGRVMDQLPYWDIDVDEIRITKVGEE